MRTKTVINLLFISLIITFLSFFFIFFDNMKIVKIGMYLSIVNIVLYLIVFFKLWNKRYNYIFSILLLFIPIYVFNTIYTFRIIAISQKAFLIPTIFCDLLISILAIIALISTRKPDKDICIIIDGSLRAILISAIIFAIFSEIGSLIYNKLFYDNKIFGLIVYLPLVFLGLLLLLYIIFVIQATIEYYKLKKVKERLGMENEE